MNDSEALENRDYLLSVLSQETTEIKQLLENALPATLQSNYEKIEFSDDEIRGLITSVRFLSIRYKKNIDTLFLGTRK